MLGLLISVTIHADANPVQLSTDSTSAEGLPMTQALLNQFDADLCFTNSTSRETGSGMLVGNLVIPANRTSLVSLSEYALRSEFRNNFVSCKPQLHVARMAGAEQIKLFKELYERDVKPSYPESEDYAEFVINRHLATTDVHGYFTKRKTVWCLYDGKQVVPLGFTVVTEKRGGSIKFGPTILAQEARGFGMGAEFRLLVESKYPAARKAYNTLPDDNPGALGYVLKAGYCVEAHLLGQYREQRGEFVVGKLLRPSTASPCELPVRQQIWGRLAVMDGNKLMTETRRQIVCDLLHDSYEEVNDEFVRAIERTSRTEAVELSRKVKRLFVAFRGCRPVGVLVVTPKRGHALKCSPLALRGPDPEAFEALLRHAYSAFPSRVSRKAYIHVPHAYTWILREARSHGFMVEGLLREPYKPGVDMIVLGRHTGV